MFKYHTKRRLTRIVFLFLSVAFVLLGVTKIRRGQPDYLNYWGGAVLSFVPIVVGLVLGYVAIFRSKDLNARPNRLSHAELEKRKISKGKHPLDDFDKPWTGGP